MILFLLSLAIVLLAPAWIVVAITLAAIAFFAGFTVAGFTLIFSAAIVFGFSAMSFKRDVRNLRLSWGLWHGR